VTLELKHKWWGAPLVQEEKHQGKETCDVVVVVVVMMMMLYYISTLFFIQVPLEKNFFMTAVTLCQQI
jgi:hypothetical protein